MTAKTYAEQVRYDVESWITDNDWNNDYSWQALYDEGVDEFAQRLHDTLWAADSVTGNASGSYYCNRSRAREMVLANIEEASEAANEYQFDTNKAIIDGDWEAWDVTTRCYFLWNACADIANELEDQLAENFADFISSGEIEPSDTAFYAELNSSVVS